MALEADLRSFVLADPAVAALIGERLHPRRLPQKPTLPAVVYQRVATRRRHDLAGPDGLPRARMQFTCWALTPAHAAQVAHAVRTRLDGHRGPVGGTTVGSVQCGGEWDYDDPESSRCGVALDFLIQVQE